MVDSNWKDYIDQYRYDDFDDIEEDYFLGVKCPECHSTSNVIHMSCGEYSDIHRCNVEDDDNVFHCSLCDIAFDTDSDWRISGINSGAYDLSRPDEKGVWKSISVDDGTKAAIISAVGTLNKQATQSKSDKEAYQDYYEALLHKCDHRFEPVELPNGVKIYCSSVHGNRDATTTPDFGLYADYIWSPSWRNEFIKWPDGDYPDDKNMALQQIYDAYERAFNGERVEIGCIGGHGRTGTILACMYMLAMEGDTTATKAWNFVKESYCKKAIETDLQDWYIEYAAGYWYGHDVPDEPAGVFNPWASSGELPPCSISQHYAMALRGHTRCSNRSACSSFAADKHRLEQGQAAAFTLEKANEILSDYRYMLGGKWIPGEDENSSCWPEEHFAMFFNGFTECARLGEHCQFWEKDLEEYNERETMGGRTWKEIDEPDRKYQLDYFGDLAKKQLLEDLKKQEDDSNEQ